MRKNFSSLLTVVWPTTISYGETFVSNEKLILKSQFDRIYIFQFREILISVMMPRRVSFKRPVVPTVNIDQFEVDLWDTSMSAATEFKTYHFECRLMRVQK